MAKKIIRNHCIRIRPSCFSQNSSLSGRKEAERIFEEKPIIPSFFREESELSHYIPKCNDEKIRMLLGPESAPDGLSRPLSLGCRSRVVAGPRRDEK